MKNKQSTFKLTIRLGNDAMCSSEDVAAALRKLADKLGHWGRFDGLIIGSVIMDDNGNKVGNWSVD